MAISKTGRMYIIFFSIEFLHQLLFRLIWVCIFFIPFSFSSRSQISFPSKIDTSEWVFYNSKGILNYKTTKNGDRIMDFSWAGYERGGFGLQIELTE